MGLRCGGGGELSYLINAVRGFSENILRNRGVPPRGPKKLATYTAQHTVTEQG